MSQNSYAEPFPVPNWNNEQAPIAWGDCIPVPVVPMGSPPMMNMLPQGMPMGANQALAPMPYPMILPPPSPFFNTPPPIAPLAAVLPEVSCDNKDKLALTELQLKYNLAAKASKNKIQEITQTLEDAQNQMADSQQLVMSANKINVEQKAKYSKLETKLTGLLSDSKKLKSSANNATDTYNSLKAELTKTKNDLSSKTRMITVLSQNQAEFTALKSTYKVRNDENQQLKDKIIELEKNANSLESKLKTSSTSLTLKSAQDNEIISSLKKKLAKLDDTNKTLTTNLSKAETNAGSQARKLTALGRSTTELTAIQSAYKARNEENAVLKKQLAELQAANDGVNTKLKSCATVNTLKGAQDNETIAGLKSKLDKLANENITIKTQLASASTAAGSQTRKLAALGQSANELTALRSAYKERNDEAEALKLKLSELNKLKETSAAACDFKSTDLQSKLSASQDSYKSLLAKVATLETNSSNQVRKIAALTSASNELTALKSAYDDLNSKKENLSTKLATATADTDKDGVLDSADKCPTSAIGSEVNDLGCPKIEDADNDGIADASDLCKNSATGSTVNEFGCTPTENITLKGVTFNTGSAQLTTASLPILNAAANTLNQNPKLNIEIAGYTDNLGIAEINKNLSKRRANTVMIHLIKKGVKAGRLTTKGYGEKDPIAANDTADGRATNRRVELKIN
jgi:outer membrane protein OmpA-like peptidoglycan-associated protein